MVFLKCSYLVGIFTVPLITGVKEKQEDHSKKIYSLLEETHLSLYQTGRSIRQYKSAVIF